MTELHYPRSNVRGTCAVQLVVLHGSWWHLHHPKALTLHRGGDALRLMDHGVSSSTASSYVGPIDLASVFERCLFD